MNQLKIGSIPEGEVISTSSSTIQGWIVVISSAMFSFFQFAIITMPNSLSVSILKEFQITATTLSQLSTSYFYFSILLLMPAGIILDRLSTRKIVLSAMSISVLSMYLAALAPTISFAIYVRLLSSISGAFCFLAAIRLATRWFSHQKLATIIGVIVSVGTMGGVIAQTPLSLLIDHFGWRHSLIIFASSGVIMLIIMIVTIKDYPNKHPLSHVKCHYSSLLQFKNMLKTVLVNRQNWLGSFCICFLNLPVLILGALWGSLYLIQIHGLTNTEAGNVSSMIFLGMIIGSPLMGWLSDKIGLRKIPMILAAFLSFLPVLLLMSTTSWSLTSLLIIFFGMGFISSAQVVGYPLIAESNPSLLTGTAEGMASTIVIAGGLTQALFSMILEFNWNHEMQDQLPIYSISDFNSALSLLLFAFFIAFILAIFLYEENHPRPKKEDCYA